MRYRRSGSARALELMVSASTQATGKSNVSVEGIARAETARIQPASRSKLAET
jgi:hypothetical protein